MKTPPVLLLVSLGIVLGYGLGSWRSATKSGSVVASRTGEGVRASEPRDQQKRAGTLRPGFLTRTGAANEADRRAALRLTLMGASTDEFNSILQTITQSPAGPQRELDLQVIFEIWGRTDQSTALVEAQRIGDGALATRLTEAVLKGWTTRDAPSAWAWATMAGTDPRYALSVLAGVARTEPERALQWAEQLPHADGAHFQAACWSIVQSVARDGSYEKALALVAGISRSDARAGLTERLAEDWARYDPAAATVWALGVTDNREQASLAWNVARGWAERDPREAAQFAVTLSQSAERKEMLASAVTVWSQNDPDAAGAWLSRLPAKPENDPAIMALATNPVFATRHPGAAMQWAERIATSDTRGDAIQAIGLRWASVDLASAEIYLQRTPALDSSQRWLALSALPSREIREGR